MNISWTPVAGDKRTVAPVLDIRLVIASPVRLVREGLAASLRGREGVIVVDVLDLGARGIARITDAEPDVVLVDAGETETFTVSVARLITSACRGAKLVAFGLDEVDERVFTCAVAGFSSYVPRESDADDLYRALVDAVEGRMHCAPHIAAAMFNRLASLLRQGDPPFSLPPLTSREREILSLVEQGHSNKQIARQLAISSATVKSHMHDILQKLRVSRRGQAVARMRDARGL